MLASAVVTTFTALLATLSNFEQHLTTDLSDHPAWLGDQQLFGADREAIEQVFTEFGYDSPIGQATYSCPGALAGTLVTLALVAQVNDAKDEVRHAASAYLARQAAHDKHNTKLIRNLLRQAGYPGLRLRQVYRHIHGLTWQPKRISFTQTTHNSHRIVTPSMAHERLQRLIPGANRDWQQQQLQALGQENLVIRRAIKPLWAVNVSTFKQQGQSKHYKLLTRLPIVYLHDDSLPPPLVGFSRPYQRHKRSARADKRLEITPWLPAIAAYRYQPSRT